MAGAAVRDGWTADLHRARHRRRRGHAAAGGRLRQPGIRDCSSGSGRLAADHLEVIVGDIGEPNLGLDQATWNSLETWPNGGPDRPPGRPGQPRAALRPVVRPQRGGYRRADPPGDHHPHQADHLPVDRRGGDDASTLPGSTEDGDIRAISPVRAVDDGYANGYGNSKWAGEVLLREAHDLCGLPVAVFRSDMILAHSHYAGQLNVPDMFTRLIFSLLVTGIAPCSFYQTERPGQSSAGPLRRPARRFRCRVGHHARCANRHRRGRPDGSDSYQSFDVMNPHDDGMSLDVFVDWLIEAGHDIRRIEDYDEWLARFETALRALPDKQRQLSVLPLLSAYRRPEQAVARRAGARRTCSAPRCRRPKSVRTRIFRIFPHLPRH